MKEYSLDINLKLKHFHTILIALNIISMLFSYTYPLLFFTLLVFTIYYLCYSFTEPKSKSLEKKLMLVYSVLMILTLGDIFFGISNIFLFYSYRSTNFLYIVFLQFPILVLDKHFKELIEKPKLKYIAAGYFTQLFISIFCYLCSYNSFYNVFGNRQQSLIAGFIIYYAIFLFYRWRKNKKDLNRSSEVNEREVNQQTIHNAQFVVSEN